MGFDPQQVQEMDSECSSQFGTSQCACWDIHPFEVVLSSESPSVSPHSPREGSWKAHEGSGSDVHRLKRRSYKVAG